MRNRVCRQGKNAYRNGHIFEESISFKRQLKEIGCKITKDSLIYEKGEIIGQIFKQHEFYKDFLIPNQIDFSKISGKKFIPDMVYVNYKKKVIHIIEIRSQKIQGSVEDKIMAFPFYKAYYNELVNPLGFTVKYTYILSEYFNSDKFKYMFKYMRDNDCNFFFNELSLNYVSTMIA